MRARCARDSRRSSMSLQFSVKTDGCGGVCDGIAGCPGPWRTMWAIRGFEDGGGAEATGRAYCEKRGALARPRELVGHRRHHARAGGAERVTERERSSVDVQALRVDLTDRLVAAEAGTGEGLTREHLEHAEDLRSESLVHVDEVDVCQAQPGAFERLRHRERGTHQELVRRVDSDVRPRRDRRQRL